MLTILGVPLGTLSQVGTFGVLLVLLAGIVTVFIKGIPERLRVQNETKQIEMTEAEALRSEYTKLNDQARKDIHDFREQLQTMQAKQYFSDRKLLEAATVQRQDRADMDTMMFLIRLLISEVKRLDPTPDNAIIAQAESVLAHLTTLRGVADPSKSDALNTAEHAVADAKQTVRSATATCEEVKASEAKP